MIRRTSYLRKRVEINRPPRKVANCYSRESAGRDDRDVIEAVLPGSKTHWSVLAGRILEIYRNRPDDLAARLQTLVEENKL